MSPPALSSLSLAILGLLSMQPMSGYDLRRAFEASALGRFSSSPGAIYPALTRLEAASWIAPRTELAANARARRPFELTEAGRTALEHDLRQPVAAEEVVRDLDHLLLRFSFMGCLPNQVSQDFLAQLAAGLATYAADLQAQLEAFPALPVSQPRLALACGLEGVLATLRWARQAQTSL